MKLWKSWSPLSPKSSNQSMTTRCKQDWCASAIFCCDNPSIGSKHTTSQSLNQGQQVELYKFMLFQQAAPKEFRINKKCIAATHSKHVQYILHIHKKQQRIKNQIFKRHYNEKTGTRVDFKAIFNMPMNHEIINQRIHKATKKQLRIPFNCWSHVFGQKIHHVTFDKKITT